MDNCEILQQDIQSLLEYFSKVLYKAKDCENGSMVSKNEENVCVCTDTRDRAPYKTPYNTHAIKQQKEILCVSLFCFSTRIKCDSGRVEPIFPDNLAGKLTKVKKMKFSMRKTTTLAYFSRSDIMIMVLTGIAGYKIKSRVALYFVSLYLSRV